MEVEEKDTFARSKASISQERSPDPPFDEQNNKFLPELSEYIDLVSPEVMSYF